MKTVFNKKKCFLFVMGSWLVAKLWWTLEISRLAFYRALPIKKIDQVSYAANLPPASHWNYADDQFAILNYDQFSNRFIIYKLPALNKN